MRRGLVILSLLTGIYNAPPSIIKNVGPNIEMSAPSTVHDTTLVPSGRLHFEVNYTGYYVRDSFNVHYTSGSSVTKCGIYYPENYATTSDKKAVIIDLHGAGQAGTSFAKMYQSVDGGVPHRIELGTFPTSFTNPANQQSYEFIVIAPIRNNGWSASGDELDWILKDLIDNLGIRIDTSRIYGTGVSAGGAGVVESGAHLDANEATLTSTRKYRFAAMLPMSIATNAPQQSWANKIVADSIRSWGFGSVNQDVYGENCQTLMNQMNIAKAGFARFTNYSGGHCCWDQFYNPTYKETINGTSMNVYEWLLTNSRAQVPDPNPSSFAGIDQSITLPTNSVSLVGSGTAGAGHTISSYAWTKIAGPSTYTITSPSSSSTTVANLVSGIYNFRLTVTNNSGATAIDDIQITVISPTYGPPSVSITSGSSQTITSPVSSVTVSASYSLNGAGLNSLLWMKLKTPGMHLPKIVVIGSSTPAGTGASDDAHSYIHGNNSLVNTFYTAHGVIAGNVTNLSISGLSLFSGMPSDYTSTGLQDPPDPTDNITAALALNPDIVIIDFNNKYDQYTLVEDHFAIQTIIDRCTAVGVKVYFMTPQPREDYTIGGQQFLKTVTDSMLTWAPNNTINKYYPLDITGTFQRMYPYGGDQIHSADSGHLAISKLVIGTNPIQYFATSSSVITSPASASTTITGLTPGTHEFLVAIFDSHGQAAYATTTIIVNNGPLNANAGSSQTIQLPTNSVTLNGSGSTGAITSYSWTRISGPNTPTITTPSAVSTTVTGLIAGTYVFQLSLNAGASASQVTITVNAAPVTGPCLGRKFTITPDPTDSSVYIPDGTTLYGPGDTLVFVGHFSSIDLKAFIGLPACPIVLINGGGVTTVSKRITLDGCRYVKLTGSGTGATYGFYIEQDPLLRQQLYHGIEIKDRSKCVEVERVQEHNVDIGIVAETNGECEDSLNYPNWIMDSIIIHDNRIVGTWNEGMYLGNTSPDNAIDSVNPNGIYDVRPVECPEGSGIFTYPLPMRNGYTKVYNNYVDSTGRGGIQLASASSGMSEIYSNTVKHCGLNGDDAQGAGINLGAYAHVNVHDNTITNTLTWGISSFGASGTNLALRIENNTIDSSGYLTYYDLATTTREFYNPNTEPTFANILPWPQSIEIDTRPTFFTDSTLFYLLGNLCKKRKNIIAINVDNYAGTLQKNGNIICGNKNGDGSDAQLTIVSGIAYDNSVCTKKRIQHKGVGRRIKRG
jgi:hypothetical protein